MWSLYNSYHYASLDRRKNKDEKINCQTIKPKKSENFYSCSIPNTKGQNFNDIFCQGNHFSKYYYHYMIYIKATIFEKYIHYLIIILNNLY